MNILNRFTIRTLMKNKTRTLVTIIGIALSVSMFTAVTSIIVSFQNYMLRMEIATDGAWEGRLKGCSQELVDRIVKEKEVKRFTKAADLGYARLKDSQNEDKPYLFVMGVEENFTDFSPIRMTEGRMPQNNTELVIPKHLALNGGVEYHVGDMLHLQLGKRVYKKGEYKGTLIGGQGTAFQSKYGEALVDTVSKTYTIVGICERPNYEEYAAPGYTALTLDTSAKADSYGVLMTFDNPSKADVLLEKYKKLGGEGAGEISYDTHGSLLRYQGRSTNDDYNIVLYSMGGILISIIMIGSVSLIYNAFSISVSERTRQFGLLKSIGATKKQMRQSVLFEAFALCLAGIPLGIVAGLGGIGITLHYVDGLISHLWSRGIATDTVLKLVVTWQSVAVAVVVGLVTVIISALIPARKAVKLPAIQAIRQSSDVRIRPEKVRTSALTYLLFGFEGMLASKNFKRSKKKHRATVFSMFISVVLFVTATSFSAYIRNSQEAFLVSDNYDVSFTISEGMQEIGTDEKVAREIENISSIQKAGYSRMTYALLEVPEKYISEDYKKILKSQQDSEAVQEDAAKASQEKTVPLFVAVYFIRDSVYRDYLGKEGLDEDIYMNTEKWTPLVWDRVNTYIDDKLFTANVLKKTGWNHTLNLVKKQEGYEFLRKEGDTCIFVEEDSDKKKKIPAQKACYQFEVTMGERQNEVLPLGAIDYRWDDAVLLILPHSAIEKNNIYEDALYMDYVDYRVKAQDHSRAYQQLSEYLSDESFGTMASASLYDVAEGAEADRALVLIIDIFSYGFIVLISLISIANVFNTISTNVQLRRQEFAMLKSVGMTSKGFDKMMNYECAMYGVKGLLYGVPASLAVSWLMYNAMDQGVNAQYLFPWQGILIVTVSVFVVVFATMLYSMSKVKKDNPIEALRNENL